MLQARPTGTQDFSPKLSAVPALPPSFSFGQNYSQRPQLSHACSTKAVADVSPGASRELLAEALPGAADFPP